MNRCRKHVVLVLPFQVMYDFLFVKNTLRHVLEINGDQNRFQISGLSKQIIPVDMR